jgi:hypothetical protein
VQDPEALGAIGEVISPEAGNARYRHVKGRTPASGEDCPGAASAREKSIAPDASDVLPWPVFGSAADNLAALNTSCKPAGVSSPPGTAKSPPGRIAIAGLIGAVIAIGTRK